MKSWQILQQAADRVGVKALAGKLNLSAALVYKWCQESPDEEPAGSGARNPLDRVKAIYDITQDARLLTWLCNQADGFFVRNPHIPPGDQDRQLIATTQRVVQDFGQLLSAVSRSIENDGQISAEEADHIRQRWESLKLEAETFVTACEKGMFERP